jgi:hypothetical protein
MRRSLYLLVVLVPAGLAGSTGAPAQRTALRFEVSVARGLLAGPTDGRVLLVLAQSDRPEPRRSIGRTGMGTAPVLGIDAKALKDGGTVVLDRTSAIFPILDLSQLPKGDYHVQAVFDHNRDLRLPGAPGNLISAPRKVPLDPAAGGTVKVELTSKLPVEALPQETESIKYLKFLSPKLSKFHGRPIYLRAGVILPPDHARDRDRKYPLRVHIGGFGQRYSDVRYWMQGFSSYRRAWAAEGAPRMIVLHLDGPAPWVIPTRSTRPTMGHMAMRSRRSWSRSSRRRIGASASPMPACWTAPRRGAGCRWHSRSFTRTSSMVPGRTAPTRSISGPSS